MLSANSESNQANNNAIKPSNSNTDKQPTDTYRYYAVAETCGWGVYCNWSDAKQFNPSHYKGFNDLRKARLWLEAQDEIPEVTTSPERSVDDRRPDKQIGKRMDKALNNGADDQTDRQPSRAHKRKVTERVSQTNKPKNTDWRTRASASVITQRRNKKYADAYKAMTSRATHKNKQRPPSRR